MGRVDGRLLDEGEDKTETYWLWILRVVAGVDPGRRGSPFLWRENERKRAADIRGGEQRWAAVAYGGGQELSRKTARAF